MTRTWKSALCGAWSRSATFSAVSICWNAAPKAENQTFDVAIVCGVGVAPSESGPSSVTMRSFVVSVETHETVASAEVTVWPGKPLPRSIAAGAKMTVPVIAPVVIATNVIE